jgi:hypothetical protein
MSDRLTDRVAWIMSIAVVVAVGAAGGAAGCSKGGQSPAALGLPDAYLLFVPAKDEAGHARRSPAGLPVVDPLALDDGRAVPFHKLFAVGFTAEMLRTDYLLKQFIRDVEWNGMRFSPAARGAAAEPTVLVLQRDAAKDPPSLGRGLAMKGFFGFLGGPVDHPDVGWVGVTDDPDRDSALSQTLTGRLGRRIAESIAAGGVPGGDSSRARVLVDGYASAMEVIAREWRVGEGPQGALAPDAGTPAQREIFAAVRQNRFVMVPGSDGSAGQVQVRPASELLQDPGVAATVIYRMAQSKGVGHRVAPPELYAPFVSERVPAGVSPAAVLGPFRNFQAKLIAVWGRAVLRGTPPRDIAELVEAYAADLPAERAEVIRLFVVTTFGATVKPGGVAIKPGAAGESLPELTALAAEVAAGRRPLRQAVNAGN